MCDFITVDSLFEGHRAYSELISGILNDAVVIQSFSKKLDDIRNRTGTASSRKK
jgi:hypothetical protein